MIKLKDLLLLEHISNPLISLQRYLTMSNWDQKLDLVNNHSYLIKQFAKEYNDPQIKKFILNNPHEDYEIIEELSEKFKEEFKDFLDWAYDQLTKNNIESIPTWYVMTFEKIIKIQWLIHFSDDAYNIWNSQKFTHGVFDLERLGYTTAYTKQSKSMGGYNFAYDISDFAKYGRNSYRSNEYKYGKEAVLFTSNGIKAHHYGDEEPQVIFWGSDAKNIVYLQRLDDNDWGVVNKKTNRIIYRAQTLSEVVKWVISNFNQYRKVLLP